MSNVLRESCIVLNHYQFSWYKVHKSTLARRDRDLVNVPLLFINGNYLVLLFCSPFSDLMVVNAAS